MVETEPTARARPRWVAWLGVVGVVVALAWAIIGYRVAVVAPEHEAGIRGYGVVAGGDHMYYGSMMLQFGGTPFAQSLQQTAEWFDYPLEWQRISTGYIDPNLAPLIYPRPGQPLVGAAFEPIFGLDAIMVPGILAALAIPFAAYLAARRMRATQWIAIPLILLLLSRVFEENGAGVYPEALLGLCLLGAAATLPWDRRRVSPADLAWLVFFIVLGTLTRQMSPAFIGLAGGALAWGLIFERDRRGWWRSWWLPTAVTTVLAGVGALLTQWWAPYDILAWAQRSTESASHKEGLLRSVLRIPTMFTTGLEQYFRNDPVFFVLLVLGAVAVIFVFRHPIVGAFLGTAAPLVLSVGLNGTGPFRYTEPALPILVLVIAVALGGLTRPEVRRAPLAPIVTPTAAGERRGLRWAPLTLTVVPLALAVTLVAATVVVYQPSKAVDVGELSADDLEGAWPLTVPRLELSCGGDDGQVWGRTPDGQRISVTGTAEARSPGTMAVGRIAIGNRNVRMSTAEVVRVAVERCPTPVPLP